MKSKTMTIMVGVILILALAIGGVTLFRDVNRNKFNWQYKVTTDEQWRTLQNDGGSKTNVYYLIDFDKRRVQKCEDKYFGPMHTYDYQGKIVYEKDFDEQFAQKLQGTLDKLWQSGDSAEGTNDYYSIEKSSDGIRYIVGRTQIAQLADYMEKFDRLP